ncbi:hypothetical protein [Brevundimonas sp. BAL3]|uniref:hypothetical protein n=1 Tax=Brevundimonas sp. BAL3 TaxID=391600 RepID=UPI00017EBADC|nr:hypothetical protein [Brevundimonas sp. BAL3]EDX80118.1 hypothetical protein BBAL3_1275 [Brevundimonas sp. BAL3]
MPAPDYADEIAALRAALAVTEQTVESNGDRVTNFAYTDQKRRLDYFVQLAASGGVSAAPQSSFGFSAVAFDRD